MNTVNHGRGTSFLGSSFSLFRTGSTSDQKGTIELEASLSAVTMSGRAALITSVLPDFDGVAADEEITNFLDTQWCNSCSHVIGAARGSEASGLPLRSAEVFHARILQTPWALAKISNTFGLTINPSRYFCSPVASVSDGVTGDHLIAKLGALFGQDSYARHGLEASNQKISFLGFKLGSVGIGSRVANSLGISGPTYAVAVLEAGGSTHFQIHSLSLDVAAAKIRTREIILAITGPAKSEKVEFRSTLLAKAQIPKISSTIGCTPIEAHGIVKGNLKLVPSCYVPLLQAIAGGQAQSFVGDLRGGFASRNN